MTRTTEELEKSAINIINEAIYHGIGVYRTEEVSAHAIKGSPFHTLVPLVVSALQKISEEINIARLEVSGRKALEGCFTLSQENTLVWNEKAITHQLNKLLDLIKEGKKEEDKDPFQKTKFALRAAQSRAYFDIESLYKKKPKSEKKSKAEKKPKDLSKKKSNSILALLTKSAEPEKAEPDMELDAFQTFSDNTILLFDTVKSALTRDVFSARKKHEIVHYAKHALTSYLLNLPIDNTTFPRVTDSLKEKLEAATAQLKQEATVKYSKAVCLVKQEEYDKLHTNRLHILRPDTALEDPHLTEAEKAIFSLLKDVYTAHRLVTSFTEVTLEWAAKAQLMHLIVSKWSGPSFWSFVDIPQNRTDCANGIVNGYKERIDKDVVIGTFTHTYLDGIEKFMKELKGSTGVNVTSSKELLAAEERAFAGALSIAEKSVTLSSRFPEPNSNRRKFQNLVWQCFEDAYKDKKLPEKLLNDLKTPILESLLELEKEKTIYTRFKSVIDNEKDRERFTKKASKAIRGMVSQLPKALKEAHKQEADKHGGEIDTICTFVSEHIHEVKDELRQWEQKRSKHIQLPHTPPEIRYKAPTYQLSIEEIKKPEGRPRTKSALPHLGERPRIPSTFIDKTAENANSLKKVREKGQRRYTECIQPSPVMQL